MSAELLTEGNLADHEKHMLEIVVRQTAHMQRLIEDLMDTTRIESGQMNLVQALHDLRNIISDCVSLHNNLSKRHKITLDISDNDLSIVCDQHRLTQVFDN